MIIPPDPEKDPNLFRTVSNSTSTTFIAPPSEPSDLLDDDDDDDDGNRGMGVTRPVNALRRTSAFSYPFSDEWAEALPPYERRQRSLRLSEGEVFADSNAPRLSLGRRASRGAAAAGMNRLSSSSSSSLTPIAGPGPSSSRAYLPHLTIDSTATTPTTTLAGGSSTKLWESSGETSTSRRRLWGIVPLPAFITSPAARKWWKKYRRWVQSAAVLFLIAIGLIVGLTIGFRAGLTIHKATAANTSWGDQGQGGSQSTSYQTPNLNLTYVPSRDGPHLADGTATNCNQFSAFNTTSATLDQLAVASSLFAHAITNFTFPLEYDDSGRLSVPGLYMISRGIAAGGTVEFVGSDGPADVIAGGQEGVISVDVVVRYPAGYDLDSVVQVCQMARNNGSVGVGIYTPIQTCGGVSNPFALNPFITPSFHLVVRLPPSLVANPVSPSMYFPSISLDLAQMAVRMGNMFNVLNIGDWSVCSARGGVVTTYVAANTATIQAGMSSVQGKFNISQSLSINATQGTILADVILYDPSNPNDNSTTLDSTLPYVKRSTYERSAEPKFINDLQMMELYEDDIPAPTHAISTSFTAEEGFIFVAYLHHPPSTSLSSYTSSSGGTVSVSMHPNFVGAFALQNEWGEVRLPPVNTNAALDPQHEGRVRTVVQGDINMGTGTLFATEGINDTSVADAAVTVTGVAFWAPKGETGITAMEVQNSQEASGSQLVVKGSWGDVQVTFDGSE